MKKVLLFIATFCTTSMLFAQSTNYDLNGDGKEDIADMTYLMNHLLNKQNVVDNHEYVDLGLTSGTLWATCNIGASKPEEAGLYFAWGETTGYASGHSFDWANYKWCKGSYSTLTKYCTSSNYGTQDNRIPLEVSDDAANLNWGNTWLIPSQSQWQELYNCTWEWTQENGVNGYKVIGSNGNSIFLPAVGYYKGTTLTCADSKDGFYGNYWASTVDRNYSYRAYSINFNSTTRDVVYTDYDYRCYGYNVRAVRY